MNIYLLIITICAYTMGLIVGGALQRSISHQELMQPEAE